MKITKVATGPRKTFKELMEVAAAEGHSHHYRYVCVECGTTETCRCPAPKTEVEGVCQLCEAGIPKDLPSKERWDAFLKMK
jgi:hypothetical protein